MRYLARLREAENFSKRPSPPSVKSAKTPPDPTFDTFGTTPPGPFQKITGSEEVHRLWLIRHEDGRLISHSFTPPATWREVRGWYPRALSVEVEDDEGHG